MGRTLLLAALGTMALAAVPATAAVRGESAMSPDGRWRAWIRPEAGEGGASGQRPSTLWLTDTRSGHSRLLLRGHAAKDARHDLVSLARPDWSLDGGYVYVEADAYATSPAIHQIDAHTGAERYVVDGALYGVLRNGPWRGYLIVAQHRYHADGSGSYDPVLVYRPDRHQIAVVPDGERDGDRAVAAWLRAKGWRAS